MGSVTIRTIQTTRGVYGISPWLKSLYTYSVLQINLGNNSNSRLEIVSALNSFNLADRLYHYNYGNCSIKYNPKVYLGAVQSAAREWNYDIQDPQKVDQKWTSNGVEKSGSWP